MVYQFIHKQWIPAGLEQAWEFFSSPKNLSVITPPDLRMVIVDQGQIRKFLFEGQILQYRIQVVPFWTERWVSEITHVEAPVYFVDEQRSGPYSMWHHQHHFQSDSDGVQMIDVVTYAVPFGWFGRIANHLFVQPRLSRIFEYRHAVLERIFAT